MKTRFTLRIEEDLLKSLKVKSIEFGISTSDYIISLIEKQLLENEKDCEEDI